MTVTISQDAEPVNLVWVAGDPISLAFTVAAVDWSGTYTAQVRAQPSSTSAVLLTLTVEMSGGLLQLAAVVLDVLQDIDVENAVEQLLR